MTYARERLAAVLATPLRTRPKAPPKTAHLTAHDFELIRALAAGGMNYYTIAHKFETSAHMVGRVVRYEAKEPQE